MNDAVSLVERGQPPAEEARKVSRSAGLKGGNDCSASAKRVTVRGVDYALPLWRQFNDDHPSGPPRRACGR